MNRKAYITKQLVLVGCALGVYDVIALYVVLLHGPVWMLWPVGAWLGWTIGTVTPTPQWIKNMETNK